MLQRSLSTLYQTNLFTSLGLAQQSFRGCIHCSLALRPYTVSQWLTETLHARAELCSSSARRASLATCLKQSMYSKSWAARCADLENGQGGKKTPDRGHAQFDHAPKWLGRGQTPKLCSNQLPRVAFRDAVTGTRPRWCPRPHARLWAFAAAALPGPGTAAKAAGLRRSLAGPANFTAAGSLAAAVGS